MPAPLPAELVPLGAAEEPAAVACVCMVVRVVLRRVCVTADPDPDVGVATTKGAPAVGVTRSVCSVRVRPDCASTVRRCLSLSLMVCARGD